MEQLYQQTKMVDKLHLEAIELLKNLIAIPSFSKEEQNAVEVLLKSLENKGVSVHSVLNNIWCVNAYFDSKKPTLLLNSHTDTVKPNNGYTNNPFEAKVVDGKLFGLGSNDAGGSLVALWATFLFFYNQPNLKYNMVFAASAEEEISGSGGIEQLLKVLPPIYAGIVGEPTQMNIAVAEKGLMVLDCIAIGKAGHAARNEGVNAIDIALKDIDCIKQFKFDKVSAMLGEVKLTVTQINAGKQHNVVPEVCDYVIDVRTNECYSNREVFEQLEAILQSKITARSFRLNSTSIASDHPLVKAGVKLGRKLYGSPTTSDKALMNFPTIKMGPGDSARSHTANEFIYINEIKEGIELYIKLLSQLLL